MKMKKNANVITMAYFAFFAMIMLSGMLSGVLSDIVYYLAYILPALAVILLLRDEGEDKKLFSLTGRGAKLLFPTVFPTVLVIILLSTLTSFLLFLAFGATSPVRIESNLSAALFYHAVLPSVFEELLFRYLPLRFIAPYSKRYAVIFSSVAFALVHHSFFSIPYALFAGVVFMLLDILCDSLLPSVMLHFVNNAVSVVWTLYFSFDGGGAIVISALAVLSLLSVIPIVLQSKAYARCVREIFSEKGESCFTYPMICSSLTAVIIAVYELCA